MMTRYFYLITMCVIVLLRTLLLALTFSFFHVRCTKVNMFSDLLRLLRCDCLCQVIEDPCFFPSSFSLHPPSLMFSRTSLKKKNNFPFINILYLYGLNPFPGLLKSQSGHHGGRMLWSDPFGIGTLKSRTFGFVPDVGRFSTFTLKGSGTPGWRTVSHIPSVLYVSL